MTTYHPAVYDKFREEVKGCPWAITEALIGNIVVENLSYETARSIAWTVRQKVIQSCENAMEDGI